MKLSRATFGTIAGFSLILGLGACNADNDEPTMDETMMEESPMDDMATDEATEDMEDMEDGEAHGDGEHSEGADDGDLSAIAPEGTGDPFADARTAAQHMPETGGTFAGAFSSALDLEGDSSSEAAELRSQMTAMLQEHVYLAGIAVATAYHAGPDSAEFELATETVDANSVALADAVGELAGDDARDQFLESWRAHIGYFVDYAVAVESGDTAGAEEAVANLRDYTTEAGMFFEEVSGGELPADAVTESLNGHVDTLAAAVDALAAGDPEAFSLLKMAGDHVVEGAAVLSGGLATATGLEGDPNDESSELRAALTANLNEHVYLAGIAVFVAYTDEEGLEGDAFAAAAEEVDVNAVELADAIGGLAGEENRDPFLQLWRDHIGYFVDYAGAVATEDDEAATAALEDLNQYRFDAGDFFEEVSAGELPADDVADGLAHHVKTLGGAIDSLNEALVQGADS